MAMNRKQKDIFLKSEANAWYKRNSNVKHNERITSILKHMNISPKTILEVGCSNGFNLVGLNKAFGAKCFGVDPSEEAIQVGVKETASKDISLTVGTADKLEYPDDSFDLILLGTCLYLCDRADLFKIAYEIDRVLKNGGYLFIKDFYPSRPLKNRYTHYDGIYSYKLRYPTMFTWNPYYQDIYTEVFTYPVSDRTHPNETMAMSVLVKSIEYGYSEEFSGEK